MSSTILIICSFHTIVTSYVVYQQKNDSKNVTNSGSRNRVTNGNNIVPFSTLANLSANSPHPVESDCFVYGYVGDDKPLGNLLILKYTNNGSCDPTIELFTNLGRVLGIVPNRQDLPQLGYDALVFIKYIEKR